MSPYAYRPILASLEMPALTNFRVSMDFCYGSEVFYLPLHFVRILLTI